MISSVFCLKWFSGSSRWLIYLCFKSSSSSLCWKSGGIGCGLGCWLKGIKKVDYGNVDSGFGLFFGWVVLKLGEIDFMEVGECDKGDGEDDEFV